MHRSDEVPLEALVPGLDQFRFVPLDVAHHCVDLASAAGQLRTLPEHVAALVVRGLPCGTDPERGLLFDPADLMNLGRASRTGRTHSEVVWRYLMGFSAGSSREWLAAKDWMITLRLPDHGSGCFRVRVPDWTAAGITRLPAPGLRLPAPDVEFSTDGYQVAVRVAGEFDEVRDPRARDVYRDMLDELEAGRVGYQCVAEPLRLDHHRAWELGMADCIVVSRVIADRFRELGLTARARRGFLPGPVGSEHAWCEIYEDSRWKTVDVGFAFRFHVLPSGQRPPQTDEFVAACFGSRFNRLVPCAAPDATSILYENSEPRTMLLALVAGSNWKDS
ncbi:transglutaminase domain-containing protein [Nocardia sp. NPDC051570]|uniref:transglutaminase domain-containing protein n=1 Tax=Nocardia sp. NPDC051570 TaxID=3364324 RepID=UPI0037BC34D8